MQFQSSVNRVESELSGQIRYLTQVRVLRLPLLFGRHYSKDYGRNGRTEGLILTQASDAAVMFQIISSDQQMSSVCIILG